MQFVANAAADGGAVFERAFGKGRRVFEAVVKSLGSAGKDRAGFFGVIANGDDIVKMMSVELVKVLGTMIGNIDAQFLHHSDGFGTYDAGFGAGAFDVEIISGVVTEKAFGHLAARGVASAEDEHALFIRHELLSARRARASGTTMWQRWLQQFAQR